GKPLIFGRLGKTPLLGLPGNPVSTLVCAILFMQPALATMQGIRFELTRLKAHIASPLKANDSRQDYLRATVEIRDGERWVKPFAIQDSSMLNTFAKSDCLILRKPHADAAAVGDQVDILPLE